MAFKIVSGGQTGVDRAALDAALELAIPCGGWCPQGRRAEDGTIPAQYPLQETDTRNYAKRTELNVRDADGTLVLNRGELNEGTAATVDFARAMGKPCLVVTLDDTTDPAPVVSWLRANGIHVLNVAGPREGKRPGIYDASRRFLRELIAITGSTA